MRIGLSLARSAVFRGWQVRGAAQAAQRLLSQGRTLTGVTMDVLMFPLAAAGWALLYYLLGGGFGGAILIFIVLKALGR